MQDLESNQVVGIYSNSIALMGALLKKTEKADSVTFKTANHWNKPVNAKNVFDAIEKEGSWIDINVEISCWLKVVRIQRMELIRE